MSLAFKSELLDPTCHVSYEKKETTIVAIKADVAVFNCIVHSDKRKLTSKPERSTFFALPSTTAIVRRLEIWSHDACGFKSLMDCFSRIQKLARFAFVLLEYENDFSFNSVSP